MTANQIAYWNLVEQKRANQAKEAETHRANVVSEGIANVTAQSHAATSQANVLNAQTNVRKADQAEELLPYEKWNKATSSAKNITSGIGDIVKSITSFFRPTAAK